MPMICEPSESNAIAFTRSFVPCNTATRVAVATSHNQHSASWGVSRSNMDQVHVTTRVPSRLNSWDRFV